MQSTQIRPVTATALTLLLLLATQYATAQQPRQATKGAQPVAALSLVLDSSFGSGGDVADYFDPKGQTGAPRRFLGVAPLGRPMVAGNSPGQQFSVGRYTKEGRPDTTFAETG